MSDDLGTQIRRLRAKRQLTQESLAKMIGSVSRSDISSWERGADYPNEEQISALCKAFEVSRDFLVGAPRPNDTMSVMESDLHKRFRYLTQYNQRRVLRFADNLLTLQRDEQSVQSEERLVERQAEQRRAELLPEGHEKIRCSFCGKPQRQCIRMIAGNDSYICDECVRLCTDILDDSSLFIENKVDS